MSLIVCPHCGNRRVLFAKVPKDVIAVLPCPACQELVVLFRGKIMGVSREIIARGNREEKIRHFAEIITEFFEAGVFSEGFEIPSPGTEGATRGKEGLRFDATKPLGQDGPEPAVASPADNPITQEELDRFVKVSLKRMDDPSYFKKHFGR